MSRRRALLALVAAGSLWGLGFVFGKVALAQMPVGAMIAFRFVIASAVLLPLLVARGGLRVVKGRIGWFVLAGVLFVPLQFLIQFEGLARTSVSHASLMVAIIPALLALVASLIAKRVPAPQTIAAILASVVGAAVVAQAGSNGAHLSGDLLVILSLFVAVSWILLTERKLNGLDPVASTAAMLAFGTIVLVAYEAVTHGHDLVRTYPLNAWAAVVAAGVLSTAASTVFWNIGLQHVAASEAGVFVNLEPVVGAACGVLFFGDRVSWELLVGGALVIAAALAITLKRRTSAPASPAPSRSSDPASTADRMLPPLAHPSPRVCDAASGPRRP